MENLSTLILFIVLIFSCVIAFSLAVLFCCRFDSRTITSTTTGTTTTIINTTRIPTNTLTIENILSDDLENAGLDPLVIETFPIIPYKSIRKLKHVKGRHGCAVCLSEFENQDTLRLLPGCCHVFHPSCIQYWLVSHATCPICRSDLSDPAVLASNHCLIGKEKDAVVIDVREIEEDNRLIGRSMSLAGRWTGRSRRWDALIKTLSGRWRKDGESRRIVPAFSDSVDGRELDMGSSNVRENNIV